MVQTMDSQRVRKPLRLPEYDYSVPGYYFVTLCTKIKSTFWYRPYIVNHYTANKGTHYKTGGILLMAAFLL